jgi:glutaredoxin 3
MDDLGTEMYVCKHTIDFSANHISHRHITQAKSLKGMMNCSKSFVILLFLFSVVALAGAFCAPPSKNARGGSTTHLCMKRPLLDQIATALFKLENNRVAASSVEDDHGRMGEPMEWSESTSLANKFSTVVASNPLGYRFKQWVADIVAGDYNQEQVNTTINDFIENNPVAMFSFTTCPFCRRAKDLLEERNISYTAMELDELEGTAGNEIRAVLGKRTKRTSVPSIFIGGQYIGGCNDGNPGLVPLVESGELQNMLKKISQ